MGAWLRLCASVGLPGSLIGVTMGEAEMAEGDQQERTQALQEVVNVGRAAVDEEFRVAERLDAKARGQVTLAGQWFAIVQAVSAVAFAMSGADGRLLVLVGLTALVGGVLVAATFVRSSRVWNVREEGALAPAGILTLKGRVQESGGEALEEAITHYASLLQDRRRSNKKRADALEEAETLWKWAMAAPLAQLALALAARLLGS